jgi:hypothetical protein
MKDNYQGLGTEGDTYSRYGDTNAAGMWIDPETGDNYPFAMFRNRDVGNAKLCVFDISGYLCLEESEFTQGGDGLQLPKPNVGAIVDDVYFYANGRLNGKIQGGDRRYIYAVKNVSTSPDFGFSSNNHYGFPVVNQWPFGDMADLTSIQEKSGVDDLEILDDCVNCKYLVGRLKGPRSMPRDLVNGNQKESLFLALIDPGDSSTPSTGLLKSYLILQNQIDWTGRKCNPECDAHASPDGTDCADFLPANAKSCGECFNTTQGGAPVTGSNYCAPLKGFEGSGFGGACVSQRCCDNT